MAKYESSRLAAKWWTDIIRENWDVAVYNTVGVYSGNALFINPAFAEDMKRNLCAMRENCIERFQNALEKKLDEIAEFHNGDFLISTYHKPRRLLGTLSGREVSLPKNPQEPCKLLKELAENCGVPIGMFPDGKSMWFSKNCVTVSGGAKPLYGKVTIPARISQKNSVQRGSDGGRV